MAAVTICIDFGAQENWNSPDKNSGVSSHSLLQEIFPTQGWNPGPLHCMQILYCLSHQGSPQGLIDIDINYRLLDYRHREFITFPPMTLKREYNRAIYTTMVWNYVWERCGWYKVGAHLGNIHIKGEQNHIFFPLLDYSFQAKNMLLIPPLKKKNILHSPLQQDLLSLLLQKAKHHPLLLCPSNQAPVTDYLMVPALVKTPILPSVSTTACHMALVYTLLLEASSTWSTRLHNLTSTPLCSRLPPLSSCSLCSGCSLHLPPSGFALATLPGWNVLSP